MLILPSALTHAAAAAFTPGVRQAVQAEPAAVVVDASSLTEFDSSALAVLLECRREAFLASKAFSVRGAPPRLRQLAGLYGVAELIPASQ